MDYGQMKLHIRSVIFRGCSAHLVKPMLVIRSGIFQVISEVKIDSTDIKVCHLSHFELGNGFLANRWAEITQASMAAWREFQDVQNAKNAKQ